MNIYVGNLSFHAMESDLMKVFSTYGVVKSVKVVTDNFTRRSRGFAFVYMQERAAGELAILKLHNSSFMQKSFIVREATMKETGKSW
jgi:RNA recognition motif-containing protein